MARIGLYGGTFDPIHHGHLISARSLAEQLDLERVYLIPAARPPHKPNNVMTPVEDRLEMARRAVAGDSLFEVSDIEARRDGPSYTIDTVQRARESFGKDAELFWFIGGDSLPELPGWHRVRELVERVTIVTATRTGWRHPTASRLAEAVGDEAARRLLSNCVATPSIGISATEIRRRRSEGRSVRYLTPQVVVEYIEAHGLYQ
ncbi:MAG: nicotinate (nicotinamide) nucleotide adenylyltransferase [Phycisphaerales bacterium]|nr:nicotinate (nicotinamide) nucleotide adenylyltransferase [Phycisphaerales bacterium]MCB9855886.1 nicotinate (nicotinamide) nucleotide adenylyltransferase [Phycisphaerales bacterium]